MRVLKDSKFPLLGVCVSSSHLAQSGVAISNIISDAKEFKSIPIHDLFYHKALDIVGSLPETRYGNKYILVDIDHYLKWCEAKAMLDHITTIVIKNIENKII